MGWRIGIEGPEAIVQQLAIVVSDHDLRLDPRRPIARLSAAELDAIDDERWVRREAERIVAILSAFARLLLGTGLIILLATPPARVVASVIEYIRERDWTFVALTLVVLLALAGSVVAAYL